MAIYPDSHDMEYSQNFSFSRLQIKTYFVSIVVTDIRYMATDKLTSSFLALRDKLHRSALSFLKNDEDARDALQDTFFNLWKEGSVETEPEARNKLFAVLRNICIDRLRKPHSFSLDESNIDKLEVRPDSYEDMENYERILTSGLSEVQREVSSLVTHEGMEYDKIAEFLNMSVEAVRMNMSRARKKIRDNYKQLEK